MKYITVMFPYPSGSGLHIGHYYNYAIADSYCKVQRYLGEEVFQPFGYDAFGLPAENYARFVGGDPRTITYQNIEKFRAQMKRMNTDFEELVITCDEKYKIGTQLIFTLLLKRGLAYKKIAPVNYCPSCETTLAREQVVEDKCERCGTNIIQKELDQWYFKITDYKQRLIDDLKKVDYPESTKNAQLKWLENLHDWCVSRQRKWGCPIPVEGETDTLDTFVDSSFYTARYCHYKGWVAEPVDIYIGGKEHACSHLIYARFVTKVLFDGGLIDFDEPFKKVVHQGMILKDGQKMSKSKGNTVDPDQYEPHILRFYLMFIGHYFDGGSWSDKNINGIKRFFAKWDKWMGVDGVESIDFDSFENTVINYAQAFKFNKVVSSFMILLNDNKHRPLTIEAKTKLNTLLNIFAPR